MEKIRMATKADFKINTILKTVSTGYNFTIIKKYDDGAWIAKGDLGQGNKIIFESEAKYYQIKL